jgi:hypothetical protein
VALEDIEDYQALEAAIIADYDARAAVERELVLRLASLLWRICRNGRATVCTVSLIFLKKASFRRFQIRVDLRQ